METSNFWTHFWGIAGILVGVIFAVVVGVCLNSWNKTCQKIGETLEFVGKDNLSHKINVNAEDFVAFMQQEVFNKTFVKWIVKMLCRRLYKVIVPTQGVQNPVPWTDNVNGNGLAQIFKDCWWIPKASEIIQYLTGIRLDSVALSGPVFGIPNTTVKSKEISEELMRRIVEKVLSRPIPGINRMDLLWIGANDKTLIEYFIKQLDDQRAKLKFSLRIKLVGVREWYQGKMRKELEKFIKEKDLQGRVSVFQDDNPVPETFDIVFATHYYQHHDKTQYYVYPIKEKLKADGLLVWLSAVSRAGREELVCEGCEPWNQDGVCDEYKSVAAFPRAFICDCDKTTGALGKPLLVTIGSCLSSDSQMVQSYQRIIREPENPRWVLTNDNEENKGVSTNDVEILDLQNAKEKRTIYGVVTCNGHPLIVMVDGQSEEDGFGNTSETDRFVLLYPAKVIDGHVLPALINKQLDEIDTFDVTAVLNEINEGFNVAEGRKFEISTKDKNKKVYVLKPSSPTDEETPNMILIFVKQSQGGVKCYYTHLPRKRIISEGAFRNELSFMGKFFEYVQDCKSHKKSNEDQYLGWTPLLHHTVTRLRTYNGIKPHEGIQQVLTSQYCDINDGRDVFFHKLEGGRVENGEVRAFTEGEGWTLAGDIAFNALPLEIRLKMLPNVYAQDVLIFAKKM